MKKTITVLLMALCSTMLMAQNVQNVKHNYNYKGKVSFEKPVEFKAPLQFPIYDSLAALQAAVPTPQNGYMAISLDTGLVAYVYGSWISLNKNNNNSYVADTPFILSQVVFDTSAVDEFICSATILGSDSFRCEYSADWQFSSGTYFMSNNVVPNASGSYVFHHPDGIIAEGTYYVRLVNIVKNKHTNTIRVVVPSH